MFTADRIILIAEILEEYLADDAVGWEPSEVFRPYAEGRLPAPVEIVFDTDEPAGAWRDKKRQLLRRAFAIKRGLSYEKIKDLPFRELVKLIPPGDR
jgi:hypothetical protein